MSGSFFGLADLSVLIVPEEFTLEELDQITDVLEALDNGEGYDETDINDMMWFEPEYLASLIGLEWDTQTGKIIR